MFNITRKAIEWGGRELSIETGHIARQADGAVQISYGETILLCTVCAAKSPKEGVDFFPLTCVYQEKYFAAGKIPGGFFKREGRPGEHETLASRLIDRPIRPLFESGFANETQIICTVLQHDPDGDAEVAAMIGASAALAISGLPFNGPIGCSRVGFEDGDYVLNPTPEQMENSRLDLIIAGTKESVMMVESEAHELTEDEMLGAVQFAHDEMQVVIDLITDLANEAGKPRWEVDKPDYSDIYDAAKTAAESQMREAYAVTDKQERTTRLAEARKEAKATLAEKFEDAESNVLDKQLKKLESEIVRGDLIKTNKRIDGRGPSDVRQIQAEVGTLPRTHGSSLFTRGETQALVVTTLGTGEDEQMIDNLHGKGSQNFMLHYNFPPFSVGEAQFLRGPGRREIGHGKLAWRALHPLMPQDEDFPYTVRLVSEITESNGSSSMATVCGSSLAMMDAGVPLKAPCAGIAMGLVLEGDDFVVLSDILGDEDHLGDMDFKVAGTKDGVTSLQMDIKVQGITIEIMKQALEQANEGRQHILGKMSEALDGARDDVNEHAPKFITMKIHPDKIREVIGSGGKVIREIVDTTGAKIDIDDDGSIKIAAVDVNSANEAKEWVENIVAEAEVGVIYEDRKVVKVVDFGAFVEVVGKTQGLVHISEIAPYRVENVTDEINEGDLVKVKVLDIDRQGKVKLSMKAVDQETGDDIEEETRRPRGDKKKRA